MAEIQLGVVEARFADIIWENEPVSSSTLVKLAGGTAPVEADNGSYGAAAALRQGAVSK